MNVILFGSTTNSYSRKILLTVIPAWNPLQCSHSLFVLLSSAASENGKTEIVIELLHRGARIDAVTKNGDTALHKGPIPHTHSLFASLLCCLSCCLSERRVREGGGRDLDERTRGREREEKSLRLPSPSPSPSPSQYFLVNTERNPTVPQG